jgi:DNA-binding MarR family transcriptional regulator
MLFTQAYRLVKTRIYDILEPYGLNPSYWSILAAAVSAPKGISLSRVAKSMHVKAPLITMLSTEIIRLGLMRRVAHPTDKRAKLLIATDKGKALSSEIERKISQEIGALLQGLDADEIGVFQKTLKTIIHNADSQTA